MTMAFQRHLRIYLMHFVWKSSKNSNSVTTNFVEISAKIVDNDCFLLIQGKLCSEGRLKLKEGGCVVYFNSLKTRHSIINQLLLDPMEGV